MRKEIGFISLGLMLLASACQQAADTHPDATATVQAEEAILMH